MESSTQKSLIEEMQCPVCLEYMLSRIFLCQQGHSVCETCLPKLSKCPVCFQPYGVARNFALEQIAKKLLYPCKNGCGKTMLPYDRLVAHQDKCTYANFRCPLFTNDRQCGYKCDANNYTNHLRSNHREDISMGPGTHVITLDGFGPFAKWKHVILIDDLGICCFFHTTKEVLFGYVKLIDSKIKDTKYYWKMIVDDIYCGTYPVRAFNEREEDILNTQQVLMVPLAMLQPEGENPEYLQVEVLLTPFRPCILL